MCIAPSKPYGKTALLNGTRLVQCGTRRAYDSMSRNDEGRCQPNDGPRGNKCLQRLCSFLYGIPSWRDASSTEIAEYLHRPMCFSLRLVDRSGVSAEAK